MTDHPMLKPESQDLARLPDGGSLGSLDVWREALKGPTTPERVVEILIRATQEHKVLWFRDADWYAVTYIPMLAVAFRLALQPPSRIGDPPDPKRIQNLMVVFMDNKEINLLASSYPLLRDLGQVVFASFTEKYQRDANERLEWLEKALLTFLPHVVSASVED